MAVLQNKRLLIVLGVVIALTIPRFVFVDVTQQDEVYFHEDQMPDGKDDLKGWSTLRVYVCDECVRTLNERQSHSEPLTQDVEERVWYHPAYGKIVHKNPDNPEETLVSIQPHLQFITEGEYSDADEGEGSWKIPRSMLPPLNSLIFSLVQQGYYDKVAEIFISKEAAEKLSLKLDELKMLGDTEGYKGLATRILRREPTEGYDGRLYFFPDEITESYCPVHNDVLLKRQVSLPVSPLVKENLPPDTGYIERVYLSDGEYKIDNHNVSIKLSIITSGSDHRSIHRPERCIPSQGLSREASKEIEVRFPGTEVEPLKVTSVLFSSYDLATGEKQSLMVFYWFASVERLTNNTFKRLFYTTWDRMVMDKNYRWSYVMMSVSIRHSDKTKESLAVESMCDFVQQFWPFIASQQQNKS